MSLNKAKENKLFQLLQNYQVSDENALEYYLKNIWDDLISNTNSSLKGIKKIYFNKYYELPLIISDRVFSLLDIDKDSELNKEEFVNGMKKIYMKSNTLKELVELAFKLYDFKGKGIISKDEVKLILNYIPEVSSNIINKTINKAFEEKDVMNLNEFIDLIENKNMDLLMALVTFLLKKKPFNDETLKFLGLNLPNKSENKTCKFLAKVRKELKTNSVKEKLNNSLEKKNSDKIEKMINLKILQTINNENVKTVQYEEYMFKIKKKTNNLSKIYYKLINKDLIYFCEKDRTKIKGIHNLFDVHLQKYETCIINSKQMYKLNIIFCNKTREYYFENEIDVNKWISKIKSAIKYNSIKNDYILGKKINEGKSGKIYKGTVKNTGAPVAIKILDKKAMDLIDLELAKTEIDILKFCNHPNIIKLYDTFETTNNIYIVMEYIEEGSLYDYLEKKNFKIDESEACKIIYQLIKVEEYLQSMGVIHRDIKPENIVVIDKEDGIDIKLIDFGLSKIIGPNELCNERYGTLGFAAPEIIKNESYDNEVDLWSIGVVTFLLLCKQMPFYDENSESEIARKTVEEPLIFYKSLWKNLSNESLNFVTELLKKNPINRLTINQAIEHPWFKKFCY